MNGSEKQADAAQPEKTREYKDFGHDADEPTSSCLSFTRFSASLTIFFTISRGSCRYGHGSYRFEPISPMSSFSHVID